MSRDEQINLRTFYILSLTQILSQLGSSMSGFAVGIWVFLETGDTTPLLLVAFFHTLPHMLGGSLAGVFVDRWDRRKVIIFTDLGQAVPTFALMILFVTGSFDIWHLYLASLIQASFLTLQRSASVASVTMLVPDSHRDRANAIQQASGPASQLLAPVLAGFLYGAIQVEGVLLIDLVTFFVAAGVISMIYIPRPAQSHEGSAAAGSVFGEMRASFAWLVGKRTLFILMWYVSLLNFLVAGPLNLTTPYIISLTGSEQIAGILAGVINLGALVGAVIFGMWGGTTPRIHTIMGGIIFLGIWTIIYGLVRTPLMLGVAAFMLIFATPMINASFMSILQAKTPPDMQGRIFALITQIAMLIMPLSFLITGPLVDKVLEPAVGGSSWEVIAPLVGSEPGSGMGFLMFAAGCILIVISLAVYAIPQVRSMEADLPDFLAEPEPDRDVSVDKFETAPATG